MAQSLLDRREVTAENWAEIEARGLRYLEAVTTYNDVQREMARRRILELRRKYGWDAVLVGDPFDPDRAHPVRREWYIKGLYLPEAAAAEEHRLHPYAPSGHEAPNPDFYSA